MSREQQRVQDLLEELRHTKASNARRIAELKQELATVRAVLQDYVRQIDSLNATNARLTEENLQLTQSNSALTHSNQQLTESNTALSETVSRASMLEITSCVTSTLNKNDHKTKIAGNIRKLQFDFTLGKNITCAPGMKELYVRVTDPSGKLMAEKAGNVFAFESGEIAYSMKQDIEYSGEAYNGVCYYTFKDAKSCKQGFIRLIFSVTVTSLAHFRSKSENNTFFSCIFAKNVVTLRDFLWVL